MKEKFRIAEGRSPIFTLLTPRDSEMLLFTSEDNMTIEVEGNTMWLVWPDGRIRETIDYPGPYIEQGWIEPKG